MIAPRNLQRKRASRKGVSPEQAQTAGWPEPDTSAWDTSNIRRYNTFKGALNDYLAGEKVVLIEKRYGLRISEVQEQLWRALQRDASGETIGFCALIKGLQVVETQRHKPLPCNANPTASACKGGLMHILLKEGLLEDLVDQVLKRGPGPHLAVISPLECQKYVTKILSERGYRKTEYPFNTRRPLYSSIGRLIARIKEQNMAENVHANEGEIASGNINVQSGHRQRQARPAPLDEVEADEHKLHGIGSVTITVDGVKKVIPTERPVGIAIVDRHSGLVLGGSVCLGSEAKEESLIEAIASALVPGYVVRLPSGKAAPPFRACDFIPELAGAAWTVMNLDNAKIHTGDAYLSVSIRIGCFTCFGPLGSWSGRPNIEGTFGQLVKGHFRQLPSTTGSGKDFVGRNAPAEQAVKWNIDHNDLCGLFYNGLAQINQAVSSGVLNQSRVDLVRNYLNDVELPLLRRLPSPSARTPEIGSFAIRVKVRRRSKDNPNMYISYLDAKYTSRALSPRADLLGELIIIHVSANLRTVRAFELSGREIGVLIADGYWGTNDHSAEIRRAVQRDKDLRYGQHGQPTTPIRALVEKMGSKVIAKGAKRSAGGVVKEGLELVRQMQAASIAELEIRSQPEKPALEIPVQTTSSAAERARMAMKARVLRQGGNDE